MGATFCRNIWSYTYDPLQQKNLLIPAYLPAELAQIDFGKKLIKTFKKSQKPFSMCKKKTFPFTRPKFQTKINFVPIENYLYPYEQVTASLGRLHKTPIGGLCLQQGSDAGFMSDYLRLRPVKCNPSWMR